MSNDTNAQREPAPDADTAGEAPALDAAALETELAKARDDLLRALADAENTRRRAERQAQEARAYAIDRFANDLLPVADTLGRALAAAPDDWRSGADETLRNIMAGLEMTERALVETFARHGLRRVGQSGDVFDPNVHQAVAQAPSAKPAGVVLDVMQPGYVLGDRTLRAAMVTVSAGPPAGASEAQNIDIKV
ncbi:MAG: nucleotide exchange factor GrpE [Hyphomonadaceae bacterium]|nr:nucleotide exchange factor GrpE [Hyphomonadaceae bacterium]MBX3511189.1 nucleotide exchange factor GrpE [Hyphomonadaceae bacterium]